MNLQFDIPKSQSSIIKVFGVGGGGGNAVNHMYQQGIKGVDFVVCNTDAQALDLSPVPTKIHIGSNLTEGRGAGSDPEVGRKAAQESSEELKEVLANNTKMVFITAGMGGGTGTGAAPVIAKIAKDMGILTVGIVTSPFMFEGPKRNNKAKEGLDNLRKNVDTILVINNERLREMYGNFPFSTAFAYADDILTTAAKGIAEIITVPGYINVDFEDVKTVMANSGVAIMGSAAAEGDDRARKAVEGALHSPLLSENDIQGASHILLNITSGTKEITMDEISIITNHIQEEAGLTADMIWGHCYDESLGEKIMVTLIATGFEGRHEKKEPEKVVVKLEEDVNPYKAQPVASYIPEPVPAPAPAPAPQPVMQQPAPTPVVENKEKNGFIQAPLFGEAEPVLKKTIEDKKTEVTYLDPEDDYKLNKEIMESEEKRLHRIRSLSDAIKSNKGLDDMEREPAYKRRKIKLKSVPHSSESNISRYTLSEEEDEISIKPKNSFLHDNID
jgi:cell division protein FtsZ